MGLTDEEAPEGFLLTGSVPDATSQPPPAPAAAPSGSHKRGPSTATVTEEPAGDAGDGDDALALRDAKRAKHSTGPGHAQALTLGSDEDEDCLVLD